MASYFRAVNRPVGKSRCWRGLHGNGEHTHRGPSELGWRLHTKRTPVPPTGLLLNSSSGCLDRRWGQVHPFEDQLKKWTVRQGGSEAADAANEVNEDEGSPCEAPDLFLEN